MEKLPKEFKKKWVAALRSGKYKQARGVLYDEYNKGYCCLGVSGKVCGYPDSELKTEFFRFGFDQIPQILKGDCYTNPIVEGLTDLNDDMIPFEIIAGVVNEWL